MRNWRALFVILAAGIAVPATALAQENPLEGSGAPPDARTHDGLYLRFATGLGSHFETVHADGSTRSEATRGIASVGEIAIGGAIAPGLILGGGMYSSSVLSSESTVVGEPMRIEEGANAVTIAGPFIDWYFDPHRGFHVQLAIGVATVRGFDVAAGVWKPEAMAIGAGIMLGAGHEWWVSDQWSFGILARLNAASAVGTDDDGVRWEHGVGASPSLLFTVTWN